jgi:poly(A) polymerase
MSERLKPQPWMTHPATKRVMAALSTAGGADCARFVGGCVRDALLGRTVSDIDIATTLRPDAVTRALVAAGVKAIPTGIAHGTVTAATDRRVLEITTLRRDVETDGRHAVVAFTDDWAEDAARRDFTMNALYADTAGTVFDPTGAGVGDLRAGRVVFVGDAATRIEEDALRILRFFRFLAWYGRGKPDAAALWACEALRENLDDLSSERVAKELLKLLAADDPRGAVGLMAATAVLRAILPCAVGLARFEGLVAIEVEQMFPPDPLLRLAALLHDDSGAARATAEGLRLSNAERDRLVGALGGEPVVSWMSPREVRRAIWRVGSSALRDQVMLAWASSNRPAAATQWRALLPMIDSWPRPVFPMSGDEVHAAGVPPGPMVGKVLREVEAWWVDNDFTQDKLSMIERLKAVAQGMAY